MPLQLYVYAPCILPTLFLGLAPAFFARDEASLTREDLLVLGGTLVVGLWFVAVLPQPTWQTRVLGRTTMRVPVLLGALGAVVAVWGRRPTSGAFGLLCLFLSLACCHPTGYDLPWQSWFPRGAGKRQYHFTDKALAFIQRHHLPHRPYLWIESGTHTRPPSPPGPWELVALPYSFIMPGCYLEGFPDFVPTPDPAPWEALNERMLPRVQDGDHVVIVTRSDDVIAPANRALAGHGLHVEAVSATAIRLGELRYNVTLARLSRAHAQAAR
jgi:hypothetical protein